MKRNYEHRTRYMLSRRSYTLIRLDGKAFHTFTKQFARPFDTRFTDMMDYTAQSLCKHIQGCKLAFVQSDEITLVLTDFETPQTDAWFDGNVQKIASISASMATAAFNGVFLQPGPDECVSTYYVTEQLPLFDSRVFQIPDHTEVKNCLIWRQEDATTNSIQMVAQTLYSHKELLGKNNDQLQDMIFVMGVNWNDYPVGQRRGRAVCRVEIADYGVDATTGLPIKSVSRPWRIVEPPIFTTPEGQAFLDGIIPKLGAT